jgi:hypothetical protein
VRKQIADRRIYGQDGHGRRVLVAAEGQPIPEGFEVDGPTRVTTERKATPAETTTEAAQAEKAAEAEAKEAKAAEEKAAAEAKAAEEKAAAEAEAKEKSSSRSGK